MAKTYYCAGCGLELLVHRKAYPNQQKIVNVVEPHECAESDISEPLELKPNKREGAINLNHIFDSFKFVSKLNDLQEKTEKPKVIERDTGMKDMHEKNYGLRDRRPKDEIRTSTAPQGILGAVKDMDSSSAEKPIIDLDKEEN